MARRVEDDRAARVGLNPAGTNVQLATERASASSGFMQMLPSTFAAHAAPGHPDIYNPVDNLVAAIRSIQRR